jgi:hypothetical protein
MTINISDITGIRHRPIRPVGYHSDLSLEATQVSFSDHTSVFYVPLAGSYNPERIFALLYEGKKLEAFVGPDVAQDGSTKYTGWAKNAGAADDLDDKILASQAMLQTLVDTDILPGHIPRANIQWTHLLNGMFLLADLSVENIPIVALNISETLYGERVYHYSEMAEMFAKLKIMPSRWDTVDAFVQESGRQRSEKPEYDKAADTCSSISLRHVADDILFNLSLFDLSKFSTVRPDQIWSPENTQFVVEMTGPQYMVLDRKIDKSVVPATTDIIVRYNHDSIIVALARYNRPRNLKDLSTFEGPYCVLRVTNPLGMPILYGRVEAAPGQTVSRMEHHMLRTILKTYAGPLII